MEGQRQERGKGRAKERSQGGRLGKGLIEGRLPLTSCIVAGRGAIASNLQPGRRLHTRKYLVTAA